MTVPTIETAATDEEIVGRVLDGDTAGYGELMRRYNQRLFRVAVVILRSPNEAEDVLQDAYVRAYAGLAGLEHRSRFGSWITAIVVNESCARLRLLKREEALDGIDRRETAAAGVSSGFNPERLAATEELRDVLEQAIERLPPIYRLAFVLREVEEVSVADTALALGISEESVRTRAYRAKSLLKRELREQFRYALPNVYPFLGTQCARSSARVLDCLKSAQGAARATGSMKEGFAPRSVVRDCLKRGGSQ